MTDKPLGLAVADGSCPMCSAALVVKAQKKSGHLCYTCPTPADGGCGHQLFARYARSSELIAETVVKKWRKPEYRKLYLAAPAPPSTEPEPVVAEIPVSAEPAAPAKPPKETAEERAARIDRELFG